VIDGVAAGATDTDHLDVGATDAFSTISNIYLASKRNCATLPCARTYLVLTAKFYN
jgi:hypothetical protein